MNKEKVIETISAIGKVIVENKDYLTDLDRPIGDSDHGINMARGFLAVEEKLPTLADKDVGTILKTVGMTLVSSVGGSSGPLYGTAFMRAAGAVNGAEEVDGAQFAAMLDAGIEGVIARGKATVGEKTMLDTLIPAKDAFKSALEAGESAKSAMEKAVAAGQAGCDSTKDIIATKGRASYLGERGIGHIDPGAASSLLMLQTILNQLG